MGEWFTAMASCASRHTKRGLVDRIHVGGQNRRPNLPASPFALLSTTSRSGGGPGLHRARASALGINDEVQIMRGRGP